MRTAGIMPDSDGNPDYRVGQGLKTARPTGRRALLERNLASARVLLASKDLDSNLRAGLEAYIAMMTRQLAALGPTGGY